jgi:hypothetical protein
MVNNSTNINKKDNYLLLQSIENKTELDIWHGNLGPGLTHVASNRRKKSKVIVKKSLKIPKGVVRISKSKKDRQYNGLKKQDKIYNTLHIKLKIE